MPFLGGFVMQADQYGYTTLLPCQTDKSCDVVLGKTIFHDLRHHRLGEVDRGDPLNSLRTTRLSKSETPTLRVGR